MRLLLKACKSSFGGMIEFENSAKLKRLRLKLVFEIRQKYPGCLENYDTEWPNSKQ